MQFLKAITETVQALHAVRDRDKETKQLISDLAWDRETLCLELLAAFVQTDFDPDYEDTRLLLKLLKSGQLGISCSDVGVVLSCNAALPRRIKHYKGSSRILFRSFERPIAAQPGSF